MSRKVEELDESFGNNPLSILGEALESAAESFGAASVNARASAKGAAKKVKNGFGAGVYHAAYGISFGLVYGAVFVTELLPEDNVVRRGFEEGAEAARDAIASKKAAAPSKPAPATKTARGARKKSVVEDVAPAPTKPKRTPAKPRKASA